MATWRELVDISSTQTLTNKTHTSPVLNTGVTGTAVKDEDDMTSDSATHLATQQSIKAYVDAQVDTADALSELGDVTVSNSGASELLFTTGANTWVNYTLAEAGIQPLDAQLTTLAGYSAQQVTRGIDDGNLATIDHDDVADDDYARFTANGLEGRSAAEVLSHIGAAALAGSTSQNFSTNDLAVTGDLTVTGTTISADVENIKIEDSVMTINSGVASGSTAADGGFIVERGEDGDTDGLVKVDGHNVGIGWDESSGYFRFSSGTSTSAFSFVADLGVATNSGSDAPGNDDIGPIGSVHVNTGSDQVFVRVD